MERRRLGLSPSWEKLIQWNLCRRGTEAGADERAMIDGAAKFGGAQNRKIDVVGGRSWPAGVAKPRRQELWQPRGCLGASHTTDDPPHCQPDHGPSPSPGRSPRRTVGVGMPIAEHPLHRSRRAALPHRAPALGHDAKSLRWPRMADACGWNPAGNVAAQALPIRRTAVAASPQRAAPEPAELVAKDL
jgi:hypothetical protein